MARSKLARIWEFPLPEPPSGIAAEDQAEREIPSSKARRRARTLRRASDAATLRAQVISYAFKHLDRFADLEPKVLQGDETKAIHDIRVATRRLQTAMDLLIPKPRPPEFRKLRRRLKRCRQILSEVRNCDAMAAKVETALSRKRTARREAWEAFQQFLNERRSKSFSKAVRKLGRTNLGASYLQLKRLLEQIERRPMSQAEESKGGELTEKAFEAEVSSRLEDARKVFEKRLDACLAKPGAQSSHQVRIAAKRLRYLIEILRECDIPASSDALVWFRTIQTHLGDLHDSDILEQMLLEMIGRPQYLREHLELSLQVARLILKLRRRKQLLVDRFVRMTAESRDYERIQEWLAGMTKSLLVTPAKIG
jgi:CHAD domain-containing protein